MPERKKNMGMFHTFMLMMKPTPAIIKPWWLSEWIPTRNPI